MASTNTRTALKSTVPFDKNSCAVHALFTLGLDHLYLSGYWTGGKSESFEILTGKCGTRGNRHPELLTGFIRNPQCSARNERAEPDGAPEKFVYYFL